MFCDPLDVLVGFVGGEGRCLFDLVALEGENFGDGIDDDADIAVFAFDDDDAAVFGFVGGVAAESDMKIDDGDCFSAQVD